MIKTLLVAYDASDHANKALKLAADIGAKYRARLVLLHVLLQDAPPEQIRKLAEPRKLSKELRQLLKTYEIEPQIAAATAGIGAVYVPVPAPRELLEAIGGQILDRAASVAKKAGVKRIDKVLVSGDPVETILKRANREKADMIVMGSRGLSGLKGLLLGSVSREVAAKATRTCVTVK